VHGLYGKIIIIEVIVMEIKEKIRNFICKELCLDGNIKDIKDDTLLIEDGIIDSLGMLNLLAFLAEKFGFVLGADELNPKDFATLQSICDLVTKKSSKSQ